MKLVIHPPIDDERLARVRQVAEEAADIPPTIVNAVDEHAALDAIRDADAFFGKLTAKLLNHATRLQWVQSPTASLEHYVFPELIAHPLTLTNMRGLFSDVIADHVMGYVICLARHFPFYFRNQLAARWEPRGGEAARSSFAAGPGEVSAMDRAHLHLADCTLGIVGLGSIGREVARRAHAFSMRVLAVDPQVDERPPEVAELDPPEMLPKLLERSDFVVIAAPHTPDTEKLLGRAQFRQMRRSAYLINIGRGAIVDLDDLTAALQAGEIGGAALDVFEIEPLPESSPLWKMENVIITPHVAACSPRIAERHLHVLLENVRRFVSSQPLVNVVNKHLWF